LWKVCHGSDVGGAWDLFKRTTTPSVAVRGSDGAYQITHTESQKEGKLAVEPASLQSDSDSTGSEKQDSDLANTIYDFAG